jgi:hypothetical protein
LPELEYATVEHFLTGQSAIEHEWLGTHYFDSSSGAKAARAGSNDAERYSATKKSKPLGLSQKAPDRILD